MAASGGGGGGGMGCIMRLCTFIVVGCLLYLGIMWGVVQVRNGRGPQPDVPDRDPCTVRCDRTGQGLDGP